MAFVYRLRQLSSALFAHLKPAERLLVVQLLSAGELLLFERMARFDQRHCLDVYHTLVAEGHTDPILLRAALIHDCGKVGDDGRPIPLIYYGVFVLLLRLAPQIYQRAARSSDPWLSPFRVHATHDLRSAWLAEAVGSPPELISTLLDYSERRGTPRTLALRWADDQT